MNGRNGSLAMLQRDDQQKTLRQKNDSEISESPLIEMKSMVRRLSTADLL
jgi:hypothetical protein